MTRPIVIDQPHPSVVRELKALREQVLDVWYGGAKPVSPHGRRYYGHDRPEYLTDRHAHLPPLPSPAHGQAALRTVLQGWRVAGEYATLAAWDDVQGGPARRALVAAGNTPLRRA